MCCKDKSMFSLYYSHLSEEKTEARVYEQGTFRKSHSQYAEEARCALLNLCNQTQSLCYTRMWADGQPINQNPKAKFQGQWRENLDQCQRGGRALTVRCDLLKRCLQISLIILLSQLSKLEYALQYITCLFSACLNLLIYYELHKANTKSKNFKEVREKSNSKFYYFLLAL